jgi:hypothetical protein
MGDPSRQRQAASGVALAVLCGVLGLSIARIADVGLSGGQAFLTVASVTFLTLVVLRVVSDSSTKSPESSQPPDTDAKSESHSQATSRRIRTRA